jgi:hypothetical protein
LGFQLWRSQGIANQRISASAWRDRVAQWRSSGLSAQAYAEQYSVPAERLNYWARRLAREARAAQLLPVRVQQVATAADVVLRSPSGWTMRIGAGAEPAWLAALLSGLR